MESRDIIPALLIIILFGTSIYAYSSLPNNIPTHWNAQGVADGFGARWTVFLLPVVALLGYLLILFLPRFDINKSLDNNKFELFIFNVLFILFLASIHFSSLAQTFGYTFNMNYAIVPAFGLLLIVIGWLLPRFNRNFFVGIRTPWTLSDDTVWKKTHDLGGKLFILCGMITFLGLYVINYAVFIMLIALLGSSVYLVIYSYIIYKQERSTDKKSAAAKPSPNKKRTALPKK